MGVTRMLINPTQPSDSLLLLDFSLLSSCMLCIQYNFWFIIREYPSIRPSVRHLSIVISIHPSIHPFIHPTVNIFTMLPKLVCLQCFSIFPCKNKCKFYFHKKILSSINAWAANQHIRMISEASCDNKEWSNDAENTDWNKMHFRLFWI